MTEYWGCPTSSENTERIITGLALYPHDQKQGAVVNFKGRFQQIDEVCESICRETGTSYKLQWTGAGLNFLFVVREGEDLSATVKFSTGFGNIDEFLFLDDLLNKRNVVYVGGSDTGADRVIQKVYTASSEPDGWARREQFVNASDLETVDQLTRRGNEQLSEMGASLSLEIGYTDSGTFTFGTDFDIGDTVSVTYSGIVTVESRIIMVREEISQETGLRRALGIGKTYPDMKSIMTNMKRITAPEIRK